MEYEIFERDFVIRTLKIIEQYENNIRGDNKFETTLLINCLFGLLILPKEKCYVNIPIEPISKLTGWGLNMAHILSWGTRAKKFPKEHYETILELVHRLRNSIAHLNIKAKGDGSNITELEFKDNYGFFAVVPVDSLKMFVTRLASSINRD